MVDTNLGHHLNRYLVTRLLSFKFKVLNDNVIILNNLPVSFNNFPL